HRTLPDRGRSRLFPPDRSRASAWKRRQGARQAGMGADHAVPATGGGDGGRGPAPAGNRTARPPRLWSAGMNLDAEGSVVPVLLAGGSGTRLWPVSRKSFPKQFANLIGEETLFQASARRMSGRGYDAPVV